MKSNRPSGFTVVATLAIVVFLLGLLGTLIINAAKLNQYIKENVQVTVFFQTGLESNRAKELGDSVLQLPFVASGNFVSSDDAVFNFKNEIGEDFVEILGDNPLPASVEISLKAESTKESDLHEIERELTKVPDILEVSYPQNVFHQIDKNRKAISFWLITLSIILVIVAIVLITNTVRILIYGDRFIIRNQQLIGATEKFILKPYRKQAFKWTALSFIFGVLMLISIVWILISWLNYSMDLNIHAIAQHFTESWYQYFLMLFLLLVGGIIVIYIATNLATKKYLHTHTDNLYK